MLLLSALELRRISKLKKFQKSQKTNWIDKKKSWKPITDMDRTLK